MKNQENNTYRVVRVVKSLNPKTGRMKTSEKNVVATLKDHDHAYQYLHVLKDKAEARGYKSAFEGIFDNKLVVVKYPGVKTMTFTVK